MVCPDLRRRHPANVPNGANTTGACVRPNSITADLQFIDWSIPPDPTVTGDRGQWTASRFGSNFILAKGVSGPNEQPCPANQLTGLTALPSSGNFNGCSTYVNPSATRSAATEPLCKCNWPPTPFRPSRRLTISRLPMASPAASSFSRPVRQPHGHGKWGTLTSDNDFTIAGADHSHQARFRRQRDGGGRNYTLTLNAVGYSGAVQSQTYTINVGSGLAITSPGTLNGQQGVPVNFWLRPPAFLSQNFRGSESELSAQGLTLTDHGNGTATIADPALRLAGLPVYCYQQQQRALRHHRIQCERHSGTNIRHQLFSAAAGDDHGTVKRNLQRRHRESGAGRVHGASTAVTWTLDPTISAPSWVKFKDNGNGTGTISAFRRWEPRNVQHRPFGERVWLRGQHW